jgi:3-oxoacyl-[acyl-carrier protein] reductase
MNLGLEGRVALVSGASRGLGFATAKALGAEGARVMISARDPTRLEDARAKLEAEGIRAEALAADMADPGAPARLVAETVARFGALHVVVANAGGPPQGQALEVDDGALRHALEQNLLGSIRLARAAVPHMTAAGYGRICCIASYSVVQVLPRLALSNTARAGLWAWVKSAAADLAASQPEVTINLVCPGPHATERMRELGSAGGSGRLGDPGDFGKVVAFLCSAPAGFVNGAAIVVDGGQTLAL